MSESLDPRMTVHGLLYQRALAEPERVFLRFEERDFTYRELWQRTQQVAGGLCEAGVEPSERVAIMLTNRPEFLDVWFACSLCGAVEVPINTAYKGALLAYQLRQAGCASIIIERAFWAQLAPELDKLPALKRIILLDGPAPADAGLPVHVWEHIRSGLPRTHAETDPAAPHAIMFTSGTTGPSKGAVMPHRYPLVIGQIIRQATQYTRDDVLYSALPLFHGNAQFLATVPMLMSGATLVLARRFSAGDFWPDVRRYGCTAFNYIGGIISILMKAEPSPRDTEHPLRLMMGAGAPRELFRAFETRFNLRLIEGYGMSEIGIPLMTAGTDTPPGSCGVPHPWYEIMLVDDAGNEVPDEQPGELLVRPRRYGAMMSEYVGMPERTVEAWRSLWFHTGDYLRRDRDGYYWFVDRKKDALRRRGENISSWELEQLAGSHPAVLEAAAVAVPSELGEDEVMLCVVPRPGESLAVRAFWGWCEAHMPAFMVPRYVRIMEALPKTPTERVMKYELRAQGVTSDTWDRAAADLRSVS